MLRLVLYYVVKIQDDLEATTTFTIGGWQLSYLPSKRLRDQLLLTTVEMSGLFTLSN